MSAYGSSVYGTAVYGADAPSSTPASIGQPRPSFRVTTVNPLTGASYELTPAISSLQFSNVRYGGDETASFTYAAPWARALPEIAKGNIVRITSGVDVLWQGRIQELDPGGQTSEDVAVSCFGLGALLKDATFREIYVDSDFGGWGDMSVSQRIGWDNAGVRSFGGFEAAPDITNGNPSMREYNTVTGGQGIAEAWYYGRGIALGSVYYSGKDGSAAVASADWDPYVALTDDDIDSVRDIIATPTVSPWSGTLVATTATRLYAYVRFQTTGLAGTTGQDFDIWWTALGVYGRHGLTKGSLTPPGFTADQIVGNIIGRVAGIVARRLDAQTFEIQQMAFLDPTYHEDAVNAANAFNVCEWGTWGPNSVLDVSSSGYFDYTSRDPATRHWTLRRADCDGFSMQTDWSQLYNRVDVVWQDVAGGPHVTTRTIAVPELGSAVRSATIEGGTMTAAEATQLADTFLALQGSVAPSRGSLTIVRPVQHYRRGVLPPWYMRADGANVQVPDVLPSAQALAIGTAPDRRTTFPISRVNVDCSGAVPQVSVDFDQAIDWMAALQARLGVARPIIVAQTGVQVLTPAGGGGGGSGGSGGGGAPAPYTRGGGGTVIATIGSGGGVTGRGGTTTPARGPIPRIR